MTRSASYRTGLLLAAIIMPVAAFAAAPPPSPPAATPAPSKPAQQAADASQALPQAMEQKIDAHINSLHKQLGITAAEEPQWNQFAQVMHDNAVAMHSAFETRGSRLAEMNAADNMQSYADLARVHASNMQALATSFQKLYASLSDEQKLTADAVFRHEEARHKTSHKTG